MDNVLHMIGMAKRAGKLVSGEEPVGALCRVRDCRLVLVAADAADNTLRRVKHFAEEGQCLWICVPYTREELGSVTGRGVCAMAAVTDVVMVGAIVKLLAQKDTETYGSVAEKLEIKAQRALQRRREKKGEQGAPREKGKKTYVPTRIKRAQKEQQRK